MDEAAEEGFDTGDNCDVDEGAFGGFEDAEEWDYLLGELGKSRLKVGLARLLDILTGFFEFGQVCVHRGDLFMN